ncbi:AI-2E family transporter [Mucilaginibacter sp. UR6-11]|uniref:AI-2E family transporter n=1 Tax=Mucilaginibacter sp. UR6-11 TaxID=1435644 RepID=UPI001E6499DC|nr:AI-2E family transporter [Mucilaginibacter sp. UR6-11]MCC8425678.1 AI-2E family transporter [Mucilaginibacter sp. UR6-11]
MTTKKIIAPFYERLSLILIGILALGFLVVQGKEILDPLLFGLLFAILLLPICSLFEQKLRLPRSISAFLSIILLVSFVGGVLYLVGSQISRLMDDWPMLQKQLAQSVNNLYDWVEGTFHYDVSKQKAFLSTTEKKIMSSGTEVVGTTFGAVSSLLLFYVFIMIFTFFILFYRKLLFGFILQAFGKDNEPVVYDIVANVQNILRQYILGLLFEMIIVATVACTAFWFIGIKYAVLLGIIVGLFNIIPYLGIFTALTLSVLITFATGPITNAIEVGISVIIIHAIDANVLLPTVVGSKARLNALITFLGIILGEMIWGLSGMFLSIPMMAIFKIIFDRIESMKPWGYLLGGDYEFKKKAEKKMKTE